MENLSPNSQVDFTKPPVPRARPPIRIINLTDKNNSYIDRKSESLLTKRAMHRNNGQDQEICDVYENDGQYTDDEESDDENCSTDMLSNTSNSLLLESFRTADNSPRRTQMQRRSFQLHNPNTSHAFNVTNSSSSHSYKEQNQPANGQLSKFLILLSVGTLIVFLVIALSSEAMPDENQKAISESEKVDLSYINDILDKSIQIIQTRFHNQRANIWNDISAAIYDVALFPTKPSIIILFGNGTETLDCLAQLLGQLSGKILGSNDYLMLTPRDFPNDVGQTIHKLKIQILQKKAVVIQELLNINAEGVKAFHNFCDKEKPLVEHSIYIITVTVAGYKSSQRELEFIEKQIFKRLSNHINKDMLDPLITRITDGTVVPIVPEQSTNFNRADCSLFT